MSLKLTIYPRNAASEQERKILFAAQRAMREYHDQPLRVVAMELRRILGVNPNSKVRVIRPRIRGRRTVVNVYSRHPIRTNPWAIMARFYIRKE